MTEFICEAHEKYDEEFLLFLRTRVRKCMDETLEEMAQGDVADRTVITADGKIVGLDRENATYGDETEKLFEIIGGEKALMDYVIHWADVFATEEKVDQIAKDALGWEPGKAVCSPDVSEEEFQRTLHMMEHFHCPECDGE